MFKYINMPKLVAFYLKEFSARADGGASDLYKFAFCLCLPFVSKTYNTARMISLSIAECTQSRDQITRLLKKITGADVTFQDYTGEFMVGYDDSNDANVIQIPYGSGADVAEVPYYPVANAGNMVVALNGYGQEQFESYLSLLIPFYINFQITYT